jgi:hypothetical protein
MVIAGVQFIHLLKPATLVKEQRDFFRNYSDALKIVSEKEGRF